MITNNQNIFFKITQGIIIDTEINKMEEKLSRQVNNQFLLKNQKYITKLYIRAIMHYKESGDQKHFLYQHRLSELYAQIKSLILKYDKQKISMDHAKRIINEHNQIENKKIVLIQSDIQIQEETILSRLHRRRLSTSMVKNNDSLISNRTTLRSFSSLRFKAPKEISIDNSNDKEILSDEQGSQKTLARIDSTKTIETLSFCQKKKNRQFDSVLTQKGAQTSKNENCKYFNFDDFNQKTAHQEKDQISILNSQMKEKIAFQISTINLKYCYEIQELEKQIAANPNSCSLEQNLLNQKLKQKNNEIKVAKQKMKTLIDQEMVKIKDKMLQEYFKDIYIQEDQDDVIETIETPSRFSLTEKQNSPLKIQMQTDVFQNQNQLSEFMVDNQTFQHLSSIKCNKQPCSPNLSDDSN